MKQWARDDSVHVRRLVSEGTRPRLPWAPRLRAFQEDPGPVIALLELLKDNAERYVQRSVANNLNDIAKDHPALAVEVCRRWLVDAPPARQWIVRHALRSLVKKGHRGALDVMGVGGKPRIDISGIRLAPAQTRIGGEVRFSFEIVSTARKTQELLIDYAVHYVKANGTARPKVFKLRKIALPPSGRIALGSAISLKDMTTRRHYPGRHRIDALVNGVPYPLGTFELQPSAPPRRQSAR